MNKPNEKDRTYRSPQSQGGIGPDVAKNAGKDVDPEAGMPNGPLARHVDAPGASLDQGDDGLAPGGFTGDDAGYESTAGAGSPAPLNPAQVLAADQRDNDRGGTGQQRPHHARTSEADEAAQTGGGGDEALSRNAAGAQGGGSHEDRAQRVEERKNNESGGGGVRKDPDGRADPAPGAPTERGRS